MTRTTIRVLCGAVVALCAVATMLSPSAFAQSTEVEGTTDFRNPPILAPGTYTDTIVTGETVWYAVVYTNNTPYRFEASLPDVDVAADQELELDVALVGPTLNELDREQQVVEGPGARYNGGETNIWYVTVTLNTEGQLGVEYDLQLDVEGVEEAQFDDCTQLPDCDLDDQLVELEQRIAETQEFLDSLDTDDPAVAVEAEVAELRDQVADAEQEAGEARDEARSAQSEADRLAADVATICAPEPTCTEPPTEPATTPAWSLAAGGVVLLAGVGLVARRFVGR